MVKILDKRRWTVAQNMAKRTGGKRKHDVNFIIEIYKRLGGKIITKGCDPKKEGEVEFAGEEEEEVEKKSGPLDQIDLNANHGFATPDKGGPPYPGTY